MSCTVIPYGVLSYYPLLIAELLNADIVLALVWLVYSLLETGTALKECVSSVEVVQGSCHVPNHCCAALWERRHSDRCLKRVSDCRVYLKGADQ